MDVTRSPISYLALPSSSTFRPFVPLTSPLPPPLCTVPSISLAQPGHPPPPVSHTVCRAHTLLHLRSESMLAASSFS